MIGLEYIMKTNKITCKELGDKLGITKQSVNKWINNKTKISQKYLLALSELFDVDSNYLTKEINEFDVINAKFKKDKIYTESELKQLDIISQIRNNISEENIELYKKFILLTKKADNEILENMIDNLIRLCNIKE